MEMVKHLLTESYNTVQKMFGVSPSSPAGFKKVLTNDKAWSVYVSGLMEHMDPTTQKQFAVIANTTRRALLENSVYQINPYETLVMPILSVFYPRLIAKELVTVTPIDKPEVIKVFLQPIFRKWNDNKDYLAPSYDDPSSGPGVNISTGGNAGVPGRHDILSGMGLTTDVAHLEKDFVIYEVVVQTSNGSETVQVNITPDVNGNFTAPVTASDGTTDVLTGSVDYFNGVVNLASVNGKISEAHYTVSVSLEENTLNSTVELKNEKIRLVVKNRQISAEWSIQIEQDLKALFDIDIQSQLVTIIGKQIALDIDKEIISHLLATAYSAVVPSTHRGQFSTTPPANYTWGPKMWAENILPVLNKVSASIYKDTNIKAGDLLAVNPLDAAVLENINNFSYTGTSSDGGEIGYQTATVAGGKYTILVSPIVPQGKMLMLYRPTTELESIYYYAPYTYTLQPYPLGRKPSLTVTARYANALVRPQALGVIEVT